MMLVTKAKVDPRKKQSFPIDEEEDGVGSTGDAVRYFVGDGVGETVNIELIVPPIALFRSKVWVPLNPTTKEDSVCRSALFASETV
mmetsp:Transcript_9799/g.22530  ORF Transcript_9799/g.22530 Transcript_9799/m.22530 type:complete len:86 (-) Transcript_9799:477-734(-)